MSKYSTVLSSSKEIIKKYDLCDFCLGRLFSKQLRLSSNKLLGKKLKMVIVPILLATFVKTSLIIWIIF